MTTRPEVGQCCIVWSTEGLERQIPIAATNLSSSPPPSPSVPLSLASVHVLLQSYARLTLHLKEQVHAHGTPPATALLSVVSDPEPIPSTASSPQLTAAANSAPGGLGVVESIPTTTAVAVPRQHLLRTPTAATPRQRKGGRA